MTTILTALTDDFMYLLSDRRLTDMSTGIPDERSNATKSILFHDSIILGFTGSAQLPDARGRPVPTAEWLGERIRERRASEVIETLRQALTDTYTSRLAQFHPNSRRLDVIAAVWGQRPDRVFAPVCFTISNAADPSFQSFSVAKQGRTQRGTLAWSTHGVEFDLPAALRLDRALREIRRHCAGSPLTITQTLVSVFRGFARTQRFVSEDVLVTMLPRPTEAATSFGIVGGGPQAGMPSAFFVPASQPIGRAIQHFPVVVLPGGGFVAEMSVSYNADPPRRL
ncbi:MAG: hypothetical protein WCL53_07425 [Chloroflexota bacterium]